MEIQNNTIHFSEWTQLVKRFEDKKDVAKIFRGQSNDFTQTPVAKSLHEFIEGARGNTVKPKFWGIVSSFDRYYNGRYSFGFFLSQQLEDNNFNAHYSNYKYAFIKPLLKCQQLERLYYLQHYGIATCLIDFTRNPLIALYFAISLVKTYPVYTPDSNGNPVFYPSNNLFVSVFEINYKRISELLNLNPIDNSFSYYNYGKHRRSRDIHFSFDINPAQNIKTNSMNYNLSKEEGCFVLFDKGSQNFDLISFINYELEERKIFEKDLITEYRLNYNEIFAKHNIDEFVDISLFAYLQKKGISGKDLFDDIQGLKYDLNFFHQF